MNIIELDDTLKDKLKQKLSNENLNYEDYVKQLIVNDITKTIYLNKGYYFDLYINKLFKKNYKNEVPLTKIQINIVKLLIANKNEIVYTEELIKRCWSNKKETSLFTLRNMIKQIRDVTYYDFIKSRSGRGYYIS